MVSQALNGKAFEYAFLLSMKRELDKITNVTIISSKQLETAKEAYDTYPSKEDLDRAANAGIKVIYKLEPNLHHGSSPLSLTIQEDAKGREGDVRDIVAIRGENYWEVGISCKHNHGAVKHSRLSGTIDIGKAWFGYNSSEEYFKEVKQLFDELEVLRSEGWKWRDIEDKVDRYYVPVLNAFMDELKRLDNLYPDEIPNRLISYLLGKNDFYKAIAKTKQGNTTIQGFNIYGSLNKISSDGKKPQLKTPKVKLPSRFYDISFKPKSKTTILIACDEGWTISCRIHSAATKVEKSLKLDVQLVGVPPSIHQHTESWT
ncbi:HaeIII family restriction endonuclease [Guptibacillus hwajinpoensis]|uniref:HaeIII restriction endonuclease n=1 Tax=Guptibacillus hwajinpoensis TaxID=208199 RepID=A0ABU0JX94_9BACL|nr:HaeIII family restriction endonuclease [Alkalihalobacillus hemicentroti]MDQ0481075.1 hypothetical protein [Alkalihalobacillus hemicentroti]